MALNKQELKLALKGYPVRTSSVLGYKLTKLPNNQLIAYNEDKVLNALFDSNGKAYGYNCELHLDHEEARRIGFVAQPEFGDKIEVRNALGNKWRPTIFIKWSLLNIPICVDLNCLSSYKDGKSFNTKGYQEWRWPKNSPYNLTKYRVYRNDEEIELSGEQENEVKRVVEGKPEEHKNQKPKEGEYWWLSGLDSSGYWKLGRIKILLMFLVI